MPLIHTFAGGLLDRSHRLRRDAAELRRLLLLAHSRVHLLWEGEVLIRHEADRAAPIHVAGVVASDWLAAGELPVFLGLDGEVPCFALELSGRELPLPRRDGRPHFEQPAAAWVDLRKAGSILERADAARLAYARALSHWQRMHRFCGACGAVNELRHGGHVMHCLRCARDQFPRTDPAIIVLVTHDDRALLGRQPQWAEGLHSVLAGFLEPGESLEEAVAREVMEEAGVAVCDAGYVGSQPWPFPMSIMLGFRARAASDRIEVDGDELQSARWFTRDEVRQRSGGLVLPSPLSISRQLIEGWLGESA